MAAPPRDVMVDALQAAWEAQHPDMKDWQRSGHKSLYSSWATQDLAKAYYKLDNGSESSSEAGVRNKWTLDKRNPEAPKIKEIQASHQKPNPILDMLPVFGDTGYKKIPMTKWDQDTEEFSRLADKLNNQLFMESPVVTAGSHGFGYAAGDSVKKVPSMETEDMRLQNNRRDYEDKRRTWDAGLLQEGKRFDKSVNMLFEHLEKLNEVTRIGIVAKTIHAEENPEMAAIMRQLASAGAETRGLVRRILEFLGSDFLNEIK